MDKTEFIMLVGLPGAGKSAFAELAEYMGYHVHSSDKIREELTGDVNSQNKNTEVFTELHKRVKTDLQNGVSCVYDATNMSMKRRKAFLDEIKKYDCKKTCILFVVPVEECKRRNQNRERKVPDEVFDKMLKQFQTPYYYEGWDHISIITAKDCSYTYPIEAAYTFDQKNSHHSKKLFNHMHDSLVYIAEHTKESTTELREAALNHDIGKLYTQDFHDLKGNPSKDAHYYRHENYGAYLYLLSEFYSISNPAVDIRNSLYVASLINWHMRPHIAWKQSEKARERDKNLIGEKMYRDIILLSEADEAAR